MSKRRAVALVRDAHVRRSGHGAPGGMGRLVEVEEQDFAAVGCGEREGLLFG